MVENVCKNCNAPLNMAEAKNGVIACSFCGSAFTLPKSDASDKVRKHLDAGETALDQCRFDDALASYTKAIEADGSEPEGYWGRALARNRVQYLRDTVNNRLQPICHEVSEESFTSDPDYKRALTLATEEQRAEYAKKGEEIDYIRSEFYALERTGLKYDCFICVKVTEEDGGHTEDSFAALKLYNALKKAGYKPFFSEEEMGERTGADYEALILYALKSAGSLLIVCSDKRYLETKWVKNEYTRYAAMLTDEEKERGSMAIVYLGKPIEKLPGIKGKLQGVDYRQFDAMDRIRAFIDSHDEGKRRAGAERAAKEREEQERAAKEKAAAEQSAIAAMQAELERMREALAARERGTAPAVPVTPAPAVRPVPAAPKPVQTTPAPAVRPAETKPVPPAAAPQSLAEQLRTRPAFEIKDGVLVKYKGFSDDVVIPDGVREIGEEAFYHRKLLKSVTIPKGVTKICGTDGILSRGAFTGCENLTKVVFPAGLKEIGASAFEECKALAEIELPGGITLARRAFAFCTKLASVTFKGDADIGENAFSTGSYSAADLTVTFAARAKVKIGEDAFSGRRIDSRTFTLPEGTETIGEGAFSYSLPGGGRLVIPGSVKTIGKDAFRGAYLSAVEIRPGVERIGAGAFAADSLKEIVLPDSIVEIGDGAFCGQNPDKKLTMSPALAERFKNRMAAVMYPMPDDGMKKVAKENCEMDGDVLTGYHLPAGARSPWGKVTVPDNTRVIGEDGLRGWDFYEVFLPLAVREIGDGGLGYCKRLQAVWLPPGLEKIGAEAFAGCESLNEVTLPASVQALGASAFAFCTALETLVIPDGVTEIADSLFYRCAGLRSVTVPASVRRIGKEAFAFCTALETLVIPDGVTEIADCLFDQCAELKSVTVPASVRRIGKEAFAGCAALETISLPETLEEIGPDAFKGCEKLKSIALPAAARIGERAFAGCANLREIRVPEGCRTIGRNAFSNCESLAQVSLPDSLGAIAKFAFAGCKALKEVTIPAGVTEIGEGAFLDCAAAEYSLPAGLKSIGFSAFRSDFAKVTVHVPLKKPFLSQPAGWDKNWAGKGVKVRWQ